MLRTRYREVVGAFGSFIIARALVASGLILLGLNGCAPSTFRMNGNFDAQSPGTPEQFPKPTPPNDQFVWLARQPLTSVVVANPAGGNRVLTTPTNAFVRDPDLMHQFLLASSEPFRTSPAPQMRGTFHIGIVGPGLVSFGVRAVRAPNVGGFIGGGEIASYPSGGGNVGIVQSAGVLDNLAAFSSTSFPVTAVSAYTPGTVAEFYYSIDQASRSFAVTVGNGASGSDQNSYSFTGSIERLELWLFLRQPSASTRVFVNNVTMEELP